MNINNIKITAMVLMALFFSGCATTSAPRISYEEVNGDTNKYLVKNFSVSSLPEAIASKLKQTSGEGSNKGLKTLGVTQEITTTLNQNKSSTNTRVTQFSNLGDGIIRTVHSFHKNDIAYGKFFSLSYAGIFVIKSQSVSISRRFVAPSNEIIGIENLNFDLSNHKPDAIHQVTYVAKNFRRSPATLKRKIECTNVKTVNASKIDENLSGKAIQLNCKLYTDSNVDQIREYWYLDTYGVAVDKSAKTSSAVITYKNIKFNVR